MWTRFLIKKGILPILILYYYRRIWDYSLFSISGMTEARTRPSKAEKMYWKACNENSFLLQLMGINKAGSYHSWRI